MRQRFERSSKGAVAPLAALLAAFIVHGAEAAELIPNTEVENNPPASTCGPNGEGCAHIRGYIKAGSDFAPRDAEGLHSEGFIPQAPLIAGPADAANRSMGFMRVSGENRAR